jgi:hypothetical protein
LIIKKEQHEVTLHAALFLVLFLTTWAMKKYYIILLLFPFLSLIACNHGDIANQDLDSINPELQIIETVKVDTFLIIESMDLKIRVKDNLGVKGIRASLTEPNGKNRQVLDRSDALKNMTLREYTMLVDLDKNLKGLYTVNLEAIDQANNISKETITFTVHDSDINKVEFVRVFKSIALDKVLEYLYWSGYTGDSFNKFSFDKKWFNWAFLSIIGRETQDISETEWNNFVRDFAIKNQTFSKYDIDGNRSLDEEEFYKAMDDTGLFSEWDVNKDSIVVGDEMASGVFNRWDLNENNMLSRDELLSKFYHYFKN